MCIDLHRYHGIKDASRLGSAEFFVLAQRLPFYEGAVTRVLQRAAEAQKRTRPAASLEQLAGGEFGARDGMAAVFEVERVTPRG